MVNGFCLEILSPVDATRILQYASHPHPPTSHHTDADSRTSSIHCRARNIRISLASTTVQYYDVQYLYSTLLDPKDPNRKDPTIPKDLEQDPKDPTDAVRTVTVTVRTITVLYSNGSKRSIQRFRKIHTCSRIRKIQLMKMMPKIQVGKIQKIQRFQKIRIIQKIEQTILAKRLPLPDRDDW